jgi:hypothetical protein
LSRLFCIQTQDGEILIPDLPDVDAVLADNSARTDNVLADALDALGNIGVDTTTANRAYYDYLTSNTEAKAAVLSFAVDAINATIDTAIAQQQAEGYVRVVGAEDADGWCAERWA